MEQPPIQLPPQLDVQMPEQPTQYESHALHMYDVFAAADATLVHPAHSVVHVDVHEFTAHASSHVFLHVDVHKV